MKKITLFAIVIFVVVLNSCQVSKLEPEETKEEGSQFVREAPPGERLSVMYGGLSDLQVNSCDTAHEAGTCDTRLTELGIVLKEECCEVLGKCC